jgi:hypothetical protein
MKTPTLWIGLMIVGLPLLGWSRPAGAAEAEAAASPEVALRTFRLLSERNIFDSTRQRDMRPEAPRPTTITAPVVEYFALNGAFIYEVKGRTEMVAFFSGSQNEYNKAARTSESIAGYRIAEVRTDGARLEKDDQKIDLPIGSALSRQGQGAWQVGSASGLQPNRGPGPPGRGPELSRGGPERADRGFDRSGRGGRSDRGSERSGRGSDRSGRDSERSPRSENAPAVTAPQPGAPQPSGSGGSPDEILKRLMERRRQEEGR